MTWETQIGNEISEAKQWLDKNELVGIPTETVYGLAGNGLNTQVLAKIFEAKNRPYFDPLILHIGNIEQIDALVTDFPQKAKMLTRVFWPGPLTILLPKSELVPEMVTSGSPYVALRIPKHPLTLELLQHLDYPLAAPSANPFTYVSPTRAQHVLDNLGGKLPYILNGGDCTVGIESTIVSFAEPIPKVLRLGGIGIEEIQTVLPEAELAIQHMPTEQRLQSAPGQLMVHYAPKCRLIPIESDNSLSLGLNDALLRFSKQCKTNERQTFYLSEYGNLAEAAQRLFSLLRMFDERQFETVYFEWVPNTGIGMAINDRLKRASSKH